MLKSWTASSKQENLIASGKSGSMIKQELEKLERKSEELKNEEGAEKLDYKEEIEELDQKQEIEKETDMRAPDSSFSDLGLSEWVINTCTELGTKKPTPVQHHSILKILAGNNVLGLAETRSGKTAVFALPILQKLAEEPYGVFAFVVTPTCELAYQLAEQFRVLGSTLHVRCTVVVGGMDKITQAKTLIQRPHVVILSPGRIQVLLEENPDLPQIFCRTKFLVLDEADRVLDEGFEDELRAIFQCLPKNRQTLLFSATMTSDLQTLLEPSDKKAYFYESYEGFNTVESLKQQYFVLPTKFEGCISATCFGRKWKI